jgi:hypothetical protein
MDYVTDANISFKILFPASPWSSSYSLPNTFIISCYFQPPVFTHSVHTDFPSIPVLYVVIYSAALLTLCFTYILFFLFSFVFNCVYPVKSHEVLISATSLVLSKSFHLCVVCVTAISYCWFNQLFVCFKYVLTFKTQFFS